MRRSARGGTGGPAGGGVDEHLADQLVGVLALAREPSAFTCATISSHLRTVAWLVERLLPVQVTLGEGRPARVEIVPLFAAGRGEGS